MGDRYRLASVIGTGASGYVYLAEDANLGRRVAVKLLHTGLVGDDAFLRRFRAEARAAADLSHPNLMGVLDWGEDADGPYLVLAYQGGGSLRDLLDAGHRLSVAQAVAVGLDAARGLGYAHRHGVVHRDIKPANLLFDEEGRLSIADFGLARALAEAAWTEPIGALIGTVRYSSPEAAQGQPVDGRADLYALGLVLIEAVSGTAPFASDTALGTLMARVASTPDLPPALGPLIPVLAGLTRIDPDQRPDDASLVSALETLAAELPRPGPLPLVRPRVDMAPTAPLAPGPPGSPAVPAAGSAPGPAIGPGGGTDAAGQATAAVAVAGTQPDSERRRLWPRMVVVGILALAAVSYFGIRPLFAVPRYHTPQLDGLSLAQAAPLLAHDKLRLIQGPRAYSLTVRPGDVVSQSPPPGALLARGSAVHVVLSKGPAPVAVPPVRGLPKAAALADLTRAGLTPKVGTAYSETVQNGDVISYLPDSGLQPRGSTVAVTVSMGPMPRHVPSFASGTTYAQAAAALQNLRLVPAETRSYSDTVAAGDVIASSPSPGATIPRGGTVTLSVSLGPHLATVPDVYGETGAAARQQLAADGFAVQVYGPDPQGGSVLVTTPAPGVTVHYGATVYVFVV